MVKITYLIKNSSRNQLRHCNVPPNHRLAAPKSLNNVLWREIPMAWGTTTDSLTPEINPFQYAIEIKYLTLKDQTSYLIPDG